VTLALRTFSALAFSLVALGLLGGCDTATDDGSRKCFASRTASTLTDAAPTCGTRQDFALDICEVSPATHCATTSPNYRCLASPGDRGVLIELSPCASVDSLPDGWTFAETYDNGVHALSECKTARHLCDGTTIPWVSPDEVGGAGGSGGAAGQSTGGTSQGGTSNSGGAGTGGTSNSAGSPAAGSSGSSTAGSTSG
jgi:uncharacterized membrane protein YgcG